MVTIKFYPDPTEPIFIEYEYESVMMYLIENFQSRDQLLDLRFFHDEILGEEVDQSDLSFLDYNMGVLSVTLDSMIPRTPDLWIYLAISLVVAVLTVALTPKPDIPSGSRDQQSATNRLGSPTNEPRINERIDDLFGSVTKHTPPLWQVPYRIGVNNQETEILLVAVGRGKYLMQEGAIYDGNTLVVDIPNAQFSKYEPGTYPGNGSPSLQIGDDINEKIGIYRQSNDLNPAELLPPNELVNSNIVWQLTGSGSSGILVATFIPSGFSFLDFYHIGDEVSMLSMNYLEPTLSEITLYSYGNIGGPISAPFDEYTAPVDVGEGGTLIYTITNVTSNSITVDIPITALPETITAWAAMSSYDPLYKAFHVVSSTLDFYTLNENIQYNTWFEDEPITLVTTVTTENYFNIVGVPFVGSLGPFTIDDNDDEIILNFVSENGFYKLNGNNETTITANINVVVEELDVTGVPTGEKEIYPVEYSSNTIVRDSVFQTFRIILPYANSRVSASRTTTRDKSDNISNVDIIKWRDLYSFENVTDLDLGDVTLAHIVIPSNSQSRLIKERKQNMDVTRLITEYLGDSVFGPAESFATDDFSQILTHVSLDPYIGRLTIDNINADGFLSLKDQIVNYFGSDEMIRFGYDFDSTDITYQDTFIQICNVVNCLPYVQNGVFDSFFEKRQEFSSAQITCRNKIEESEAREDIFEREFDGVEISYRDELTSISETVYLPEDRSATNPDRIELPGCITNLQAFRYANRVFNKQKYSRLKVSFDVDEFGRNIIPGKRIDSPDGTRFVRREGVEDGYRVYNGEVIEVNGLNVELSEPVAFTEGEDHYIVFTKENGDNSEPILCTSVDDFTIALKVLPSEAIYDGYSKDRTKFVFVSEQLQGSIALIPQTIEFKIDDNGDETNTVGSINYSHSYYKDDLEFPT